MTKKFNFFYSLSQIGQFPTALTLNNLNGLNKAASMACFDLSFPYTNIWCGQLIGIINEHIDFYFEGGYWKFIVVDIYEGSVE